MSMPIQRQSDTYGAFDDGPRYARDHTSRDLPEGLADMLGGPRISAGMNNPRGIAAAWGGENPYGPAGPSSPLDYFSEDSENSMRGMSDEQIEQEDYGHDPHRFVGENEVRAPGPGGHHPDDHPQGLGGLGGGYDDYDPYSAENIPHEDLI